MRLPGPLFAGPGCLCQCDPPVAYVGNFAVICQKSIAHQELRCLVLPPHSKTARAIRKELTVAILLCNDSPWLEEGTPCESKGRKATGLRGNLGQRGCQVESVSDIQVQSSICNGIAMQPPSPFPSDLKLYRLPEFRHRISSHSILE